MKLGLLSNERMARGINWTLLSDPLFTEFDRITDSVRLAPAAGAGFLRELPQMRRSARGVDAVFSMHGKVRPPWQFQALSWAAKAQKRKMLRAVFYVDPWAHLLERIARIDRILGHDLVFVPYREAFDILSAGEGGERYRYLPFAADTGVFRDTGAERDIDILWMGRRDEPLHQALLALADAHGLNYLYREKMGFIDDPNDLGALAERARYFVATPPDPERSGGFSPLVMRYLEGLAAGCRLLGTLPKSGEFEASFPRGSMLEVRADGSDLEDRYLADQGNTAAWGASAEAARIARQEHGWDARAKQVVTAIEQHLAERA